VKALATTLRVVFMGRKPAGVTALRWTLREPVRVVAVIAEQGPAYDPVRDEALRAGVPVLSHAEASEAVGQGALSFDVGVSFVYDRILRPPLLTHPRLGILNFHPAPLPEYKGLGGYNLAILNGLGQWAVSVHYVDEGIDTGPIVAVRPFDIDSEHETALSLEHASMKRLLALYRSTFRRVLRAGQLPTRPNEGGRYVTRLELEGMKSVRFGDDVDRKIRAFWFPPYTGATVELEGQRYTLVNDAVLQRLASSRGHSPSP
jgi:methionyl-tRNA formyltransferase